MEFVLTPDRAGLAKADPDFFKIALGKLGTDPDKTYVFDDALYAIKNANKLGLITVGVYDESSKLEEEDIKAQADHYIHSFKDLDVAKL